MPCPWLVGGKCTSPKLGRPSAMVVSEKCFRDDPAIYTACEYYVEPPQEKRGRLTSYMGEAEKLSLEKAPFLPHVHALLIPVESECPYYVLAERGAHWVAFCKALERFLGKHEVWRCAKHWRTCPIAKMHRSILEEQ